LKKQLKDKESDIGARTKLLEEVIEEYKTKLQNLINTGGNALNQIRDQEAIIKQLNDREENSARRFEELAKEKKSLETQVVNLRENLGLELNKTSKLEEKYKHIMKVNRDICVKLEDLYKKEVLLYKVNMKQVDNINNFIIIDKQ
jgi:hypothetical protein